MTSSTPAPSSSDWAAKRHRLGRRQAKTVHASIDMEGRGSGAGRRAMRETSLGVVEDGPQIVRSKQLRGFGEEAAEHVNDRVGSGGAHALSFLRQGDEERPASGRRERRDGMFDADPVSVGLHRRGAFRRPGERLEPPPVAHKGGEINGDANAGAWSVGRSCPHP